MSIKENIFSIAQTLPQGVKLVAVSKTKPNEAIIEVYEAGFKAFGENKVQELLSKYETLPKDIEWHFIGHLQTNKVKYIAPFISMVHSVDSLKLLREINKQAIKNERVINCLLQFYIANEETKFGLSLDESFDLLNCHEFTTFKNIRICGVMGMATFTDDSDQVKQEFCNLKEIFAKLKHDYFINDDAFCEISMGMSDDYQLAIACGSTIVRIGSTIFGERNYTNG